MASTLTRNGCGDDPNEWKRQLLQRCLNSSKSRKEDARLRDAIRALQKRKFK